MQAIKRQELFEDKILKEFREDIELTTESAKEFSASLLKVVKDQAAVAKSTKNNAEGYRKLVDAEKKSVSAMTEKEKIDKKIITLQKQSNQVTKLQRESLAKLNVEMQRRNKTAKEAAILDNKHIGAYEKMQIKIKKMTAEYRNLVTVEGQETRQARILKMEILALNKVRDRANESLGMHQHKVGQYERALGGLTRTLGALGLSFGVFTLLRSTLGILTEYEAATASLSAITGATGEQLDDLKGKIITLSKEMGVSVTETTKLFEIVGSQMPQLLQDAEGLNAVAKASIILSKASGDTIEASTLSMASAMNQFNLGADQAERVMNVLAAGSLVGSAGIADVSDAMKNFGSVASGANISLEQSVALIEVLGKFGVIGAEAGTKLRGSVLKLQQANFGYASGQFQINDALEEARVKMNALGTEMERDAFLQKTFGAENISTGRILLANTALFEEYTKGVTGTNVATEQAAINSNTMSVVIEKLKASWEALVIEFFEGTGTMEGLKNVILFVADNLKEIIKAVVLGVKAWIIYKSVMTLVNKEGTGMIQMFRNLRKGVEGSTFSLKTFTKGLGGIVGIALILVPMLWDAGKAIFEMFKRTTALEGVTEKYNKQLDAERAKMDLLRVKVLDAIGNKTKMGEVINEINANYGTTIKNIEDETLVLWQLEKAYKAVTAEMEKKIMQQILEEDLTELFRGKREAERALAELGERNTFNFIAYDLWKEGLDRAVEGIAELQNELFLLNGEAGETGKTLTNLRRSRPENIAPDTAKGTAKKTKTQQDIDNEYFKRYQQSNQDNLKIIENNAIKSGKTQEEIAVIMANARLEVLKMENEKALELFGQYSDEFVTANLALNKELMDQQEAAIRSELERNRLYFEELKNSNSENVDLLENELLKQGKARLEIDEALKKQRLENLKRENEEALRLFGEYSAEYQQANLALNRALLQEEEDAQKKREELREKAMEAMENAFQDLVKTLIESMERMNTMLDRGITRQEKLFEDSKNREDELRKIAEERGLNATESIEHERDVQKQAQLEIDKLEAKKRELELTIAALKLLSDGHSVADIKSQLGDIMAFAKNLPAFYEGTPHTVADSLGSTGTRDGHVVRVDDNEAIFTGRQTAALGIGKGGRSTQDVVDMVTGGILQDSLRLAVNSNKVIRPSIHVDTTSQILANKMDEVIENTKPENQPVSNMGFNAMVGYFELDYRDKLRKEKTRYFTRKPRN